MPPAQALVAPRSFSDDHHPTLNPTYVIWSLSFIFISGSFLAGRFIIRRRHPMHDNALFRTTFTLPTLLTRVWRVRKRASSFPTVSTLVSQSTIVASSPLHLGIILNSGSPSISILRWSTDFLCRGLEQSLSWGRTTIGLLCLAVSTSAALIRQSFSNLIYLNAAPSDSSGSLSTLHNTRVLGLFSCLRQRIGFNTKRHVESHDPMADADEPEPDLQLPDTINIPRILLSTDDALLKTETPVIPLIVLSLPTSDHLFGDPPPPVALDEDLLSPDGTFRSTRQPAGVIADINETTRLALASRLRERRKRLISLPSSVLGASGMAQWPRWF
ncbi:hypothetical protein BJV74DRAFT_881867 [Russula compacta]|nr:hypothetical protein BJV74DRAFT_881867 [Russula compacta]